MFVPQWKEWYEGLKKVKNLKFVDNIDISNLTENDIIIPSNVDNTLFVIGNLVNKTKAKFLCGDSLDNVKIFNNKAVFSIYCIDNNLGDIVPITYVICVEGNRYGINDLKYPNILKPSESYAGTDIVVFGNEVKDFKIKQQNYIIQEFILGVDHVGMFYVKDGKIIVSYYYCDDAKRSDIYITQGKILNPKRRDDLRIHNNLFERLFIPMNYTGFATVDFRITPDDKIKIFEVNPRLGGTILASGELNDFIYGIMEKIC